MTKPTTLMHQSMTSYIEGMKTAIDRLGLDSAKDNRYAEGYRTALDDLGNYVNEVEAGLMTNLVNQAHGLPWPVGHPTPPPRD